MATTPNYGWVTPAPTDFVTDLPADFEVFADAVDASFAASEGDLLVGTSASIFAPLTIGANATVLTSDGTTASWVAPAAPTVTFSGCALGKSAQTISNNTNTAITWTSETIDTDSYHDTVTNTTRITIPAGKTGKFLISGQIFYQGTNTSSAGNRNLAYYKNGSYVADLYSMAGSASGTAKGVLPFNVVLALTAADYVEIYTDQNSGTSLDVTGASFASCTFLGA